MNDPIGTFLILLVGFAPWLFLFLFDLTASPGQPLSKSKSPQQRAAKTTSHPTTERGMTSDFNGGGYDGGGNSRGGHRDEYWDVDGNDGGGF